MATADDDTQTAPAPDTAPPVSPDMLGQALQLAQQYGLMPQAPQRDTTPTKRSWTSLLGEALGGGPPVSGMTDAEREIAGHRALGDFGTSLMAASRYQPGQTLFSNLGAGFAGAQRGEIGSEELAMAQLGAQQGWAQQQAQNRVEAIKAALPFLRLQAAQGIPNPLAGGTTPAPNTSIAAAANGTYESTINNHEGAGKDPNSSAVGGFLSGTWNDFAAANPDLFKGMSPAQILAARSNSALRDQATSWLAKQNAGTLTGAGVTPSGQSLGIAHYIGAGPAAKVMAAPDNAPVSSFVSDAAVKANPELGKMTVGQLKQRYAAVPDPGFLKPTGTATAAATPAAAQPGVQMGGPPPAPPGGSGAPSAGGGIGAALALPTPPIPPATVPTPGGTSIGTGKLLPKRVAGDVSAIQAGRQLAQGGLPAGTVAAAGPAAGTPPAASVAWGPATTTTIGDYNAPGATPAPTTTPPAQPAPQGTTQADQPPAQPPVTTPAPGQISFEDWQKLHPGTAGLVTPPDLADALAAKKSAAQTLDRIYKGLSTADENKATQAFNDASDKVARLQQEAQSKSIDAQRNLYDQEMQRQQQDRLKQQELAQQAQLKAQELAQQVAENEKNRQAQIQLKQQELQQQITLKHAETDEGLRADALKGMDAETKASLDDLNNLQALRELSRAAGPATPLSDEARQWLVRWGMTSPSQASQYAAQSALDEANNRMIGTLRQGMGFQRTTDKDLAFLSANTPGGAQMPQEFRDARTAFLIDQRNRTIQFNKLTRGYMQSGMTYPDAATKADAELGPIIKSAPTLDAVGKLPTYDPTVSLQTNRDRVLWDNVPDGSFYKDQGGNLKIMHKTDKNGNPYARP